MKYKPRSGRQFEQLEARQMLTVSPEFVADIRPGEVGSNIGSEWIVYKNEVYFNADDGTNGRELWKSDGTEEGTQLVKDIFVGEEDSRPGIFALYDDLLYFTAEDVGTGDELWRTDGTTAGTERVVDIYPGEESGRPIRLTTFQDTLFFSADNGPDGSELYRSDGTPAGTRQISDIFSGPSGSFPGFFSGFVEFRDQLYFAADGTVNGDDIGTELYRTDGTTAELVLDADGGDESSFSLPTEYVVFQGDLYFLAELALPPNGIEFASFLYRVDGDTGEVEQFFDLPVDFREELTIVGDTMYFASGGDATGIEVYKTDGTQAGTQLVKDVFPGVNGSRPQNFFAFGDKLYFSAGDNFEANSNRVAHQLWVSGGTPETTIKMTPEIIDPETPFVAYRNDVYFMAEGDSVGFELFKTNGTPAGTEMVVDVNVGSGNGFPLPKLVFEDQLLFLANNGTNGFEIWTWDGTSAEMAEVHLGGGGFTADPDLFQFTEFGNDLIFRGSTPFEGDELFIIRGSDAVEPLPGDADGNDVVDFADFLVLSANFGKEEVSREQGDFDGDNTVDFADFLILSGNFGRKR